MAPLFLLARPPNFTALIERPGYDEDALAYAKLFLAVIALLALMYEAFRESEGEPLRLRTKRFTGGVLAVVGVVCYFQFFQIGYREFYHRWEFFHYYVGAKYYKSLGYEGIYKCTAVAEYDLGFKQEAKTRKYRDLEHANLIVDTTDVLAHPERCHDRFSESEWNDFKTDVAFFRRVAGGTTWWKDMQKDHGYNPTPVWGVTGWIFAKLHPAVEWYMKLLSCIDVVLFAAMFGMVAWAFGWRVMCLAVVFWGTEGASAFYWTGGAFLRQDWLFYLIASACMLKKRKYAWGGAFLTYSTLLRVFPLFFFGGWVVTAASHFWKTRTLPPPRDGAPGGPVAWLVRRFGYVHYRLLVGSLAAGLVLIPASVAICGPHAWPDFIHHIGVHKNTPLTNNMGWKTLVAHTANGRMQVARDNRDADPFEKWKKMRESRVHSLAAVYYAGILAMGGLFAWACWKLKNPWIVMSLGCLLATIGVELTCYYYSYFILGAMLARGRRPIEFALLIAAAASELCAVGYGFFDDRFTAMALIFVNLGVFIALMYARSPFAEAGEILTPVEERTRTAGRRLAGDPAS